MFDLDGTLVDSYPAIAESLNYVRRHYGMEPLSLETVRSGVGRGLEKLIAELVGAERVEQGSRLFRDRYAEVWPDGTRVLPAVTDTIDALVQRGYRTAIASNKPARFTREIAERLGLARYMGAIHGPDSVGAAKPEPAMLQRCMSDLGLPSTAGLYVGDMALDAETAARAGFPVLLVSGGSSSLADLQATGCRVLGAFDELLAILE